METNAAQDLTQERWRQIKSIFEAAVELDASERDAFLEQACSGDEALRLRVTSLLSSDDEEWELFEKPAFEAAASLFAEARPALSIGQYLGHYKVLDLLGKGGMGEVYLAEDEKLGRKIALKLLPSDFSTDQLRMHRFQQEARAASSLNHPNIITIHEIGQFDDRHFIATEFIEGRTLRQLVKRRRPSLIKAVDIAIQAASALAAAHEVGVVHRDIKPENIMVRPDGYVKVLDFGLAQLNSQQSSKNDTETLITDSVNTAPGLLMGTVNYMSPEQTRGSRLDARSDIFSLGVVIYEAIAGRPPFDGATTSDLIAAILKVEPQALTEHAPSVPPDLQRILSKALRKDRDERYQTIKDMLVDLRGVKKEMEQAGEGAADAAEGGVNSGDRLTVAEPETAIHARSSGQQIVTERKHRRTATAVTLAVLVVGALALVNAVRGWFFSQNSSSVTYLNTRLKRITNTGKSHSAAISPDGKYVAYLTRDGEGQYLWISQVASGSKLPIGLLTQTKNYHDYGLTFSPDGDQLYYVSRGESDTAPTLYRIPTLGGPAQKVISGVDSQVSASTDGNLLAFVRNSPGESKVIVANADGAGEQTLAVRRDPDFFWSVAWSPDGKKLACAGMRHDEQDAAAKVIELDVASGQDRQITTQKWGFIYRLAWLSDGSGLIMLASDKQRSKGQLWLLSYPSGEERRITTDLNNYSNLHLSADSSSLVTTVNAQRMNLWISSDGDAQAKQITAGDDRRDGMYGVSWTPDGRIVYSSSQSGPQEIWITELDGSNQKQLTVESGQTHSLCVSPDGRYVVYVSERTGDRNIWRVNIDGSNPTQLTRAGGFAPYCSADSKWVFYLLFNSGKRITWKIPIEGGDPVQLTNAPPEMVGFSPDGKLMAYVDSENETKKRIGILPSEGRQPTKFLDLPASAWRVQWGSDSQTLTYVDRPTDVQNIWNQPLDGGSPIKMTDLKGVGIAFYAWSPDGKQVAIAGRQTTSDVVLIDEVK